MVVGQFVLTPLLQNVAKLSAPVIGMLSYISKGCYYLALASSSKQWMVMQISKNENMQICRNAAMPICKYANMQICKYANMQICKAS